MKQELRVSFCTLGCRSNYADSVELQAALLERGAIPCDFRADADVYVINSCTITESADKDVLKLVRRARTTSPKARIIVTGCMAEVSREKLEAMSEVDAVLGLGCKSQLLQIILDEKEQDTCDDNKLLLNSKGGRLNTPISPVILGPGSKIGEAPNRARFHLRIEDGCDNRCSYCIVPQTRGPVTSRPIKLVLDDLTYLQAQGYQEVVLTGTHLGGYGKDLGSSLIELLLAIVKEGFNFRIRISSLDPNELSTQLVSILVGNSIFCEHLHLSIQSFSDRILCLMGRKYTLEEVKDAVNCVITAWPGCCIGADLITGFPGESRQEVEQGINEFLALPISYLHVFPYSERANTPAVKLDGSVPFAERKERAASWREASAGRKQDFYLSLIGKTLEVVVEKITADYMIGTSREYAAIRTKLFRGSEIQVGQRMLVKAVDYDYTGKKLLAVEESYVRH